MDADNQKKEESFRDSKTKAGIPKVNFSRVKLFLFLGLALVAFVVGYVLFLKKAPETTLPTYFSYSEEELAPLKKLSSKKTMETEDLYIWDRHFFDLVSNESLKSSFDEKSAGIYAYLAVGERDVAHLSYNLKGRFLGDVKPIAYSILCFFSEEECHRLPLARDTDEYSKALADLVLKKVKERVASENAGLTEYPEKTGEEFWNGPQPSIGRKEGSKKPWLIRSGSQFRVPPPPVNNSEEMLRELAVTNKALAEATEEEKRATVFWAGGPGTKTPPGLWLEIADSFMRGKNVSLPVALDTRALLTMAVADANIAVFDSKYTYWAKRPFMYDHSIVTVMPTPNHPSYPAGHSALSSAAATVLSFSFPEETRNWEDKAEEAGLSRIWGGIHFMIDHERSTVLGKGVGSEAIRNFSR